MKYSTKKQKGSPSRDKFKWMHKHIMSKKCWALDVDLELVEKEPRPFIVARLDFKMPNDFITFSEALSYQITLDLPPEYRIPIYIIEATPAFMNGKNEELDIDAMNEQKDNHRFTIRKLLSANYKPKPPTTETRVMKENITWEELAEWEVALREYRRKEIAELIAQGKLI